MDDLDYACKYCGRCVLAGVCCSQAAAESIQNIKKHNDEELRQRRQAKAQRRAERYAQYEERMKKG